MVFMFWSKFDIISCLASNKDDILMTVFIPIMHICVNNLSVCTTIHIYIGIIKHLTEISEFFIAMRRLP